MKYLVVPAQSPRVLTALQTRRHHLLEEIKKLQDELDEVEQTIERLGDSSVGRAGGC